MKRRIQMNTPYTHVLASLAIISLASYGANASMDNKLSSAFSFIPDVKQIEAFA